MLIEKGITLGVIDSFHRSHTLRALILVLACSFVFFCHSKLTSRSHTTQFNRVSLSRSAPVYLGMRFWKYVSICNWIMYIKFICRQFATLFSIPFNWIGDDGDACTIHFRAAHTNSSVTHDEKNLFVGNCWKWINGNIRTHTHTHIPLVLVLSRCSCGGSYERIDCQQMQSKNV